MKCITFEYDQNILNLIVNEIIWFQGWHSLPLCLVQSNPLNGNFDAIFLFFFLK